MNKTRPKTLPPGWAQSIRFRQISRDAIRAWNAQRDRLQRCGARRRSDGEPCRQWPMQNGRCYLHGGRTPRGENWHRPQWSSDFVKTNRKLDDRERKDRKRAARVAAMTAEERAAYFDWQKTHRPGPPA